MYLRGLPAHVDPSNMGVPWQLFLRTRWSCTVCALCSHLEWLHMGLAPQKVSKTFLAWKLLKSKPTGVYILRCLMHSEEACPASRLGTRFLTLLGSHMDWEVT